MEQKRVLSGIRPTGKLHLGNFHGAVENWLELQEKYDCHFFVADWHALTTDYEDPARIGEYTRELFLELMALGLSPERSVLFVQSRVKEHAELQLLLGMFVPLPWLERNPTYKEVKDQLAMKNLSTYGFIGYPVLQAADIIMYKADYVPVGVDQLPHVELTREIARRFNHLYREVFPVPEPLLTEVPKLLGTDGRKMSKSYDNCIFLSDPEEVIKDKVSHMVTDPARKRRTDPGEPEVCPVFGYHKIYQSEDKKEEIARGCREAAIGCVECKGWLLDVLLTKLVRPFQEKKAEILAREGYLDEAMNRGKEKAQDIARATMEEVRSGMGIV